MTGNDGTLSMRSRSCWTVAPYKEDQEEEGFKRMCVVQDLDKDNRFYSYNWENLKILKNTGTQFHYNFNASDKRMAKKTINF